MANPITVGTTAIVAVTRNRKRVNVRFQNVWTTTLYFIRQFRDNVPVVPSSTNYEVELLPWTWVEIDSDATFTTNSTSQFNVASSASWGSLAIFETVTA